MIERIVSLSDEDAQVYSFYGKGPDRPFYQAEVREIITRCKDCRFRSLKELKSFFENDRLIFDPSIKDAYHCSLINRIVSLSGFCKWGIRRKDVQ